MSRSRAVLSFAVVAAVLASLGAWLHSGGLRFGPPPPNVVIISVDGLRHDYAKTMESLETFFREASVFEQAITSASYTPPSLTSLHTGLFPLKHGVHLMGDSLPEEHAMLGEILKREGFYTEALVAVNIIARAGLDREGVWDRWTNYNELPYKQADHVTDRALEMLGRATESRRPYFLWVHYFDPHIPFRAPGEYYDRSDVRPEYHAEVRFLDAEMSRLLERIDWTNTIVVFTADHGWGLRLEHDYEYHYHKLYEEQIRVPLLVHVPGRPGGSISRQVRTVDVFPTVLEEVGAEYRNGVDGVNLFSERVMPTYSETNYPRLEKDPKRIAQVGNSALQAIRWRGLKLIYAVDDPKQSLLFDLEADPKEEKPLDLNVHERDFINLFWLLQSFTAADTTDDLLRSLGYATD